MYIIHACVIQQTLFQYRMDCMHVSKYEKLFVQWGTFDYQQLAEYVIEYKNYNYF